MARRFLNVIAIMILLTSAENVLARSSEYSLMTVVNETRSHNKKVELMSLRADQAKARAKQAWSAVFPQVSLQVEKVHNELNGTRLLTTNIPLGLDPESIELAPIDAVRSKLSFSQVLFDHKIPKQLHIGRLQYEVAEEELAHTTKEEVLNAVTTYFTFLKSQLQHRLAILQVELLTEQLEEMKAKEDYSRYTRQDVLEVQGALAEYRRIQSESEHAMKVEKMNLNIVMGRLPNADLRLAEAPEFQLIDLDITNTLGILKDAELRRSDLIALKKEAELVDTEMAIIKSRMIPTVSSSASFGYTDKTKLTTKKANQDWIWSINGSMPLFDGWKSTHQLAEKEALYAEKNLAIIQKDNEIYHQIVDSIYKVEIANSALKEAKSKLLYTMEQVNGIAAKRRVKKATSLELLHARIQQREAETKHRVAKIDQILAHANLYFVMGNEPI